jgi:WD40 repeat protein
LTGGGGWLRALGWSADGRWIAAGGEEGTVRIWNVDTGAVTATQPLGPQPVWSLAWSPDGRSLAMGTGTFDSRTPSGTLALWPTPVPVSDSASASGTAQRVEAAILARGRNAPLPEPRRAPPPSAFSDGGAYGSVLGPDPPFGNLETSFVEADLIALGISLGTVFQFQCRDKTFRVKFGTSWADVAAGEWAAFVSLDKTLVVSRNNASAATASGCAAGDRVFVSK